MDQDDETLESAEENPQVETTTRPIDRSLPNC